MGNGYKIQPKFSFGEEVKGPYDNSKFFIEKIRVIMSGEGKNIYSYDLRMEYIDPGYGLNEKKSKIITDVDESVISKLKDESV